MVRERRGMRVKLLFPPSDRRYKGRKTGYSKRSMPPQTAHAVLPAWLRKHSKKEVLVESMSDQKPTSRGFEDRSPKELTDFSKDSDIVGITCWYHNLENALSLSQEIKKENPEIKIVLGGPGVSNPRIAGLILGKHQSVDLIVEGDGEEAFTGIVEARPVQSIPNVWYRDDGVKFTFHQSTDLSRMPLWDFTDTVDYEKLLEQHRDLGKNEQSMIGIFSNRGCPKANRREPCIFCSSNIGGTDIRILPPEIFWKQRKRLQEVHGITDAYCSDNVFTLSLRYVKRIAEAKERDCEPLKMRIYSYPTDIVWKGGSFLVEKLREIGVYNVFFGIENFSHEVNRLANKDSFEAKDLMRAIEILRSVGIGTTISLIVGLPGENSSSLQTTQSAFRELMQTYGNRGIQRAYISLGMPLIGTPWYDELVSDESIRKSYIRATGRELEQEIAAEYDVLRELSIKEHTSLGSTSEVYEGAGQLIKIARDYLPEENIGGYGLEELTHI